ALRWHRAGDLGKAEALYRRALQRQPEAAAAAYLLAVTLLQRHNPQLTEAIGLMERCLAAPAAEQAALGGIGDIIDKALPIDRVLTLATAAAAQDAGTAGLRLAQQADRLQRALLQVTNLRLAVLRRDGEEPDEYGIFLQQLLKAVA